MQMNKRENIYSLKGMSKVLKFTLTQTFKNPAYRGSLIIFVLVMALMNPIQTIISNNSIKSTEAALSQDLNESGIKNLYVANETPEALALSDVKASVEELAGDVSVSFTDDADGLISNLNGSDVVTLITPDPQGYMVKGVISDDSEIRPSDLSLLTDTVAGAFDDARMANSDLSAETITLITRGIGGADIYTMDDYLAEQNKTVNRDMYISYALGYCILAMIVISMSNSYIISSVTEEKISKLVETLLVSVRPMALLLGKVLGMMSYAVSVIVLGFLGSKITSLIMKIVYGDSLVQTSVQGFSFEIFTGFGVKGLVIVLICVVIAYLSFSLLSGLFGSACVKQEDIQTATGFTMMITMVGYIGAIFGGIPDNNTINVLFSILPPFSYYSLPVMYLCGRIGFPLFALSLLLQIAMIAGLLMFSAKTYRNLILSDSSTPKLSAILKSAKA